MGQAPVWLHPLARPLDHANYTSVLASAGWMDAVGLAGLIASWRHAYDCIRPDLVLCDHAPTAALAAGNTSRRCGVWEAASRCLRHTVISRQWPTGTQPLVPDADDASLLTHVNAACALIGDPPLTNLPSLFDDTKAAIAPRFPSWLTTTGMTPTPRLWPVLSQRQRGVRQIGHTAMAHEYIVYPRAKAQRVHCTHERFGRFARSRACVRQGTQHRSGGSSGGATNSIRKRTRAHG